MFVDTYANYPILSALVIGKLTAQKLLVIVKAIYAILISFGVCAIATALEGACAGKNVKSFFATLRFPRYSPPLRAWTIIGGTYYLISFFVIYRLLRINSDSTLRYAALSLVLFMMIVNALTNYIIFRAHNLRLSFIIGALFPLMDTALFICLTLVDHPAAWSLVPYLLYRIYAVGGVRSNEIE